MSEPVTMERGRWLPHSRWRALVGAVVVQLILGTIYGYSIFWEPLQAEASLPVSQAKYAFGICTLSFAMVMVVAGRVQDLLGPRVPTAVGGVLMGGGFILASFASSPAILHLLHAALVGVVALVLLMLSHAWLGRLDREQYQMAQYVPMAILAAVVTGGVVLGNQYVGTLGSLDQLFLLWGTVGFLAGAGVGFAYVCPIAALVKWFPTRKGLMSGVAVAGFGFGAFLFKGRTLGALGFIESQGIHSFFLVHGLVCVVAIGVGSLLLSNPPTVARGVAGSATGVDSPWQDTLKRPAFYGLWLMYFSGSLAGLMVIGIVTPFVKARVVAGGADAGEAVAIGAMAMSLLAIFNAVGRIFWGMTSDRIGRTGAFVAVFLLQAGVMFALGGLGTEGALYVGASLVGFNYGGCFALFPSATADFFGAKNLGVNYGWLFTSYGIAGLLGIAAGNIALDRTGSYAAAFTFAGVLCLLSAGLAVVLAVARNRGVGAAA